jgi:hypothetical protein
VCGEIIANRLSRHEVARLGPMEIFADRQAARFSVGFGRKKDRHQVQRRDGQRLCAAKQCSTF